MYTSLYIVLPLYLTPLICIHQDKTVLRFEAAKLEHFMKIRVSIQLLQFMTVHNYYEDLSLIEF